MPETLFKRWCFALIVVSLWWVKLTAPAGAQDASYRKNVEKQFVVWLANVRQDASRAGISSATIGKALSDLTLDWSLPDLDPPEVDGYKPKPAQPQRQPEFGHPHKYFPEKQLAALQAIGKQKAAENEKILTAIATRYGVPGNVLLAVWGRETAFGRAAIPYDAIRSLATLAFMGRRPDFFRPELFDALKIIQEGHVSRNEMKSSWAGAMGQTQMLPSVFNKYAVDFDEDGHKDIWNSVADSLATTANFLRQKGWKAGLSWGYEISLAGSIDCTFEGPDQGRSFREWAKLGASRTRARRWQDQLADETGYLVMPAGVFGPAFIATGNFYAIKAYNESDLYVLYVGTLADRIAGARAFDTDWQVVDTYTREEMKSVQNRLVAMGYDVGDSIDGLVGFKTRVALGLYQKKAGKSPQCWPQSAWKKRILAN